MSEVSAKPEARDMELAKERLLNQIEAQRSGFDWLPIGRILFAYHYFPTVLFLCFAIAYLMDDMISRVWTPWW